MIFITISDRCVEDVHCDPVYAMSKYIQGAPTSVFRNAGSNNQHHSGRVSSLVRFVNDALQLNQKKYLRNIYSQTIAFSLADSRDSLSLYIAWGARHNSYFLIPDPLFLQTRGYELDRYKRLPWRQRSNKVFWRGSLSRPIEFWSSSGYIIPRYKLVSNLADEPFTDVNLCSADYSLLPGPCFFDQAEKEHNELLTKFPKALGSVINPATCPGGLWRYGVNRITNQIKLRLARRLTRRFEMEIRSRGLVNDPIPMADWRAYRYAIDIDGYGPSWKLFHCLSLGIVLLKVESDFQQFVSPYLKPYIHYIPVSADLSDLKSKIRWVLSNPDIGEGISRAASSLADSLDYEWALISFLQSVP